MHAQPCTPATRPYGLRTVYRNPFELGVVLGEFVGSRQHLGRAGAGLLRCLGDTMDVVGNFAGAGGRLQAR